MTIPEYKQLQAFARVDGLKLFLLWIASFACYVAGLRSPGLGLVAMVLALLTPFYCFRLLRRFRDEGLDGTITFGRGWLFVLFVCFNASLLFAAAQFVYFSYLDNGFFMGALNDMLSNGETRAMFRQMGMVAQMDEALRMLGSLRPIDMVLNILLSNLMTSALVALPVAAFAQRTEAAGKP